MEFENTNIKQVYIIKAMGFEDDRGMFRRHFCSDEFKENKIEHNIQQSNISENLKKFTLRGFHYQTGMHAEAKTLSCLKGKIYDIVLDLREGSETYKKWVGFEISEYNRKSIHIPKGCANAFLTLEDNCLIHYYCSNRYDPDSEKGIRYNDPSFNFKWPETPLIISNKDLNHKNY